MVLRGLIVKEPYASLIVDGLKTWEIRKNRTRVRGRILIINKGYVKGSVELYDVKGPFTAEELIVYKNYHHAPQDFLISYSNGKKLYAWLFRNPIKLNQPIKINIPQGAQVWVRINSTKIKENKDLDSLL